ncbi:bifunctional diguanylate cyclase/phosphodiesterase [Vibrio diazotrophicus]|uniref:bifunctional diguanylate cyclase/phosphodiesterase n=2 Tax=Vibrio diazotrophicus TaxID=685 RepID=UPI0012E0620A|nr:EAL domain-containing protein [Vibrio diazotrophicus]
MLEQQESILELMGSKLITNKWSEGTDTKDELDRIMSINPDLFSGFALISTQGEVLEVSSNLVSERYPNLMRLEQTKDSFQYALSTKKMVIGRTYYAPRFVIPARKSIYSADGKLLGVMTGALRLDSKNGIFHKGITLGDFNRIAIIRQRDRYFQYISDISANEDFYKFPISRAEYSSFLEELDVKKIDSNNQQDGIKFIRFSDDGRGMVRGIAFYHPRYEFWLTSEIEESFLNREFLMVFLSYFFIFSIFQIFILILFKNIDRTQTREKEQLKNQAYYDHLTKLPNRNYLESVYDNWKSKKEKFSLLFLDMDNFKEINDRLGHTIGDEIIISISKKITSSIPDDCLFIRNGGDEFILVISTEDDSCESKVIDDIYRILESIEASGNIYPQGASIGISRYPENGSSLMDLLRASDIAMYEAKKTRNRYFIYEPDLEANYRYKSDLGHHLRGAIKRGEIFLNYQPQISGIGDFYGVEALVRWNNPSLGNVPPNEFILVAEQTGLMNELGEFIIRQSLTEISDVKKHTGKDFNLSINISTVQLLDGSFTEKLSDTVLAFNYDNTSLTLEVTETAVIDDIDKASYVLSKLRADGFNISLDDFGTCYSSLSMLRHLPIDELKIDKSFVDNIICDESSVKMIRNIISLGSIYNLQVLAEGIESKGQFELLRDLNLGCNLFQGYYFSKPLSKIDLENYINNFQY